MKTLSDLIKKAEVTLCPIESFIVGADALLVSMPETPKVAGDMSGAAHEVLRHARLAWGEAFGAVDVWDKSDLTAGDVVEIDGKMETLENFLSAARAVLLSDPKCGSLGRGEGIIHAMNLMTYAVDEVREARRPIAQAMKVALAAVPVAA